jgi:hypothetical protein
MKPHSEIGVYKITNHPALDAFTSPSSNSSNTKAVFFNINLAALPLWQNAFTALPDEASPVDPDHNLL